MSDILSTNEPMNNLLIVGAQRCGTTLLHNVLDSHPAIEMAKPVRPEPKFFLRSQASDLCSKTYIEKAFGRTNATVKYYGEKSTSYIDHVVALERIRSTLPNARIILMLRDPLLRAWSNYKFSRENGCESLSFIEAIETEEARVAEGYTSSKTSVHPNAYLQRSNYCIYVERLREIMPEEHFRIIILEEMLTSPQITTDLFEWLELEPTPTSCFAHKRFNQSIGELLPSAKESKLLAGLLLPMIYSLERLISADLSIWHSKRWYSL